MLSAPFNKFPSYWKPQADYLKLVPIYPYTNAQISKEAELVIGRFYETMKKKADIIDIQMIQNRHLYRDFCYQKFNLLEKKKCENKEVWAFHGTRNNDPTMIYKSKEEVSDLKIID